MIEDQFSVRWSGILIPKKSEIRISNIGLMGERVIQITRSTENEYFSANDTVQGQMQQSVSIGEGIGKLASNLNASASISQKLDSIIVLLNKQMEFLEENQVRK